MGKYKPFWENESLKSISKFRTPMNADNKYRRLGLLFIGFACVIAGVIILISAS